MEQRAVYIDEELVKYFLNVDIEVGRCFLYVLNNLQMKNRMTDNNIGNYETYFKDEVYVDDNTEEFGYNSIKVNVKEFRKFGIIKNKSKLTYENIESLLHEMCCRFDKFIEFYFFEGGAITIQFYEEYVFLNENGKSLLTPHYLKKFDSTFIAIDMIEYNQLISTCQIFLYFKIKKFNKTGKVLITIQKLREAILTDISTKKLIVKINKAIEKIMKVTNKQIEIKKIKDKREITRIELNFNK